MDEEYRPLFEARLHEGELQGPSSCPETLYATADYTKENCKEIWGARLHVAVRSDYTKENCK